MEYSSEYSDKFPENCDSCDCICIYLLANTNVALLLFESVHKWHCLPFNKKWGEQEGENEAEGGKNGIKKMKRFAG